MAAAVTAALRAASAAGLALTPAMAGSISSAMAGVYASADVELLDFVTAGDRFVCGACLAIEAKNPWRAGEVPFPPRHERCRCIVMPAGDAPVPAGFYDPYLTGQAEEVP